MLPISLRPIPKEMSSIRLIGQSGLAKALRTRVSTPKTTITMPSSEKMAEDLDAMTLATQKMARMEKPE